MKELIQVLDEIILLLQSDEEKFWCNWMIRARQCLLNSDFYGIELLLEAYGGMGSFNDLIICKKMVNGKITSTSDALEKNENLKILRSRAWHLATMLKAPAR